MNPPASTTSAPSGTSAGISSRSGARDGARRPQSGLPGAPPAESGTGTTSPTETGSTPSPPRSADPPGIGGRLRDLRKAGCRRISGEISLLRSLLPAASPDLSPETVGNWPVRRGEWVATPDAFPGASPSRHTSRPFDLALSLFLYEGDVREGIRAAKYGGRSDVARTLARRLFEAIRGDWADRIPDGFCPTIVPVPIRPWKYFRRGYNFPALVALSLVRLCG